MFRTTILIFAIIFIALAPLHNIYAGAAKAPEKPGTEKIGLALKRELQAKGSWPDNQTWAECFVKLDGKMKAQYEKELRNVGLNVRSVVAQTGREASRGVTKHSTIITGNIRLVNIPSLVALPYVESVEGAVKLHNKAKKAAPPSKKIVQ